MDANDAGRHNCPPAIGLAGDRGLTLRQGQERRQGDRRSCDRGQPDRRRRERRRNRIRSLIFTALAFTLPQSFKFASVHLTPRASVSTWIDSVTPITPWQAYESAIQDAAALYDLEPALIRSVIQTESAFDALAVSRAGARGLMQLMPDVADEMGVQDSFNARENIMGGARLLRNLLNHFKGNVSLTLAGYNAGPGAVARFGGGIPPFRETRDYVERVNSLLAGNRRAGD